MLDAKHERNCEMCCAHIMIMVWALCLGSFVTMNVRDDNLISSSVMFFALGYIFYRCLHGNRDCISFSKDHDK